MEKVFATGVQCETYSCKALTLAHRKYSLGFGHKVLKLVANMVTSMVAKVVANEDCIFCNKYAVANPFDFGCSKVVPILLMYYFLCNGIEFVSI